MPACEELRVEIQRLAEKSRRIVEESRRLAREHEDVMKEYNLICELIRKLEEVNPE